MYMNEGRAYFRSLQLTGVFPFSEIPRPTLRKVTQLKIARGVMILGTRFAPAAIEKCNRSVVLPQRRDVVT